MLSCPSINRSITSGHESSSPPSPYRASTSDSSFTAKPLATNQLDVDRVHTFFLGAGNFSFPYSFIDSRGPNVDRSAFARGVLVTEFKTKEECLGTPGHANYDPEATANYNALLNLGAQVEFEVDATCIDQDNRFKGHRFQRIQFNCPEPGTEPFCGSKGHLPSLVERTAHAASRLQAPGDTLHFTVIAPEGSFPVWVGNNYELPNVERAGYYLNRGMPNLSGTIRYRIYRHKKTFGPEEVEAAQTEQMAEYIFVRDHEQRTPSRYLSSCYGFKQRKNQNGELERVQEGSYTYYNRRPGPPMSPTIEPPSFFDQTHTRRKRSRASFHPALPPLREASSPVLEAAESMDDDLKLDLMDLDPGKMRRGLRSMSRSVVHAQRLGRGRAS